MQKEIDTANTLKDPSPSEPSLSSEQIFDIISRVLSDDENAFSEIIHHFASRLQAMIYRIVLDWDETRDISQETFIGAYQNLSRYDPKSNFQSWLFVIGARKALDSLRRRKIRQIPSLESINEDEGREDSAVILHETELAIERAMLDLSSEQRLALSLSVI